MVELKSQVQQQQQAGEVWQAQLEQQLEHQSTEVQQLKQRSTERMRQLRGQVAELQGQVDQQQPITMDQVCKLVEDS